MALITLKTTLFIVRIIFLALRCSPFNGYVSNYHVEPHTAQDTTGSTCTCYQNSG